MGQYVCKLYTKKDTKILVHGLGGAGKTTIVYLLKVGEVVPTIPSIGFSIEQVKHRNFSLTTWDISGRDKVRPLFRHYFPNTRAIMFVIDSTDRDGLEIIADELHKALLEEVLHDAVFLILANKQDLDSAMSLDEIKEGLNYDQIVGDNADRRINIFGCSAVTEEGQHDLYKGLDWMCDQLYPPSSSWWWFWRADKPVTDSSGMMKNPHTRGSENCVHKTDMNENIIQDDTGIGKTER